MDGVTDASFRYMICKYCKPSVVITEFTNVEGLARGNVKGLAAFIYSEIERPIVAQIFGVEPESYYKAAILLCSMGFDGIDINMGCPVNKVAAKGSGAALIKTPELAKTLVRMTKKGVKDWAEGISLEEAGVNAEIIAAVKGMMEKSQMMEAGANSAAGDDKKVSPVTLFPRRIIPVSIKTRIGYDSIVAEGWVKHLLEVEPANISMHGRTLKQLYTGVANWEEIAKACKVVKESGLGTTFLGNGDVKSLEDAREKVEKYGVDGVLVGRATFGNPYFFAGREPTAKEGLLAAIEHSKYFEKLNESGLQNIHFQHIRKHLGWYCKGFEGAKELRMKLMQTENAVEVEKEVGEALGRLRL